MQVFRWETISPLWQHKIRIPNLIPSDEEDEFVEERHAEQDSAVGEHLWLFD